MIGRAAAAGISRRSIHSTSEHASSSGRPAMSSNARCTPRCCSFIPSGSSRSYTSRASGGSAS
ncbi:hypothetical protein STENM223S_00313 [Streptomyces tendae]